MDSSQRDSLFDTESPNEDSDDDCINTGQAKRRLWLAKLPGFLIDRWNELEGSDTDLGVVRIHEITQDQPAKVTFHLSSDPKMSDLPKTYDLTFLKNVRPDYVFSENNGVAVAIEGKIEHECHLKPLITEEYRKLMKTRDMELRNPKRTVQVIDNVQDKVKFGLLAPFSESSLVNRRKKMISSDLKRERLPRAELMDLLFTAFEKNTLWSLKDLVDYTNQPTVYLKEVLLDIAEYNKSGPNKNSYHLRSEYISSPNRLKGESLSQPSRHDTNLSGQFKSPRFSSQGNETSNDCDDEDMEELV